MSALKTKTCHCCGGNGKELDHRSVGEEMRKRRKQSGKSQIQVAKHMKVSGPYISDLESGKRGWRKVLIDSYMEALEV